MMLAINGIMNPIVRATLVAGLFLQPVHADETPPRAKIASAHTKVLSPSWVLLKEALQSDDYAERLFVTQILGDVRGSEEWLARSLYDKEHDVRIAAVDGLRRLASPRAVQLLRKVRDDTTEKHDIRALAAGALLLLTGE
jgi:hypothetical protein